MTTPITSEEFEEKVLKAPRPVMVDFYADWCGPCKALAPTVAEIAEEMQGKADVYSLNVDNNRDIAMKYGVMSIPTVIVFENGEIKNQTMGAVPKPELEALFD